MCISSQIKKLQAEKEALDAKITKLEQLQSKTAPVKNLLSELLKSYSEEAPEDLAAVWDEVLAIGQQHKLSVQPLVVEELKQWEAASAENLTTIESIFISKGFFHALEDYKSSDKYETYRGWDIYYSFPNGGIVGIGLYSSEQYNQPWDALTEYIQEVDPTFPESLADYDAIVTWTRKVIDEVVAVTPAENLEALGQLALGFPEPTDAQIQEELGCNWEDVEELTVKVLGEKWKIEKINDREDGGLSFLFQGNDQGFTESFTQEQLKQRTCSWGDFLGEVPKKRIDAKRVESQQPEQTNLQKLLANNSNFTFDQLGASVAIQSVFIEGKTAKFDDDDPAVEPVEEALITVCTADGQHREYCVEASTFVYKHRAGNLEQAALGYAQHFLQELEKDAKIKEKITQWKADDAQQLIETVESKPAKPETETEFEAMGYTVQVYPQLPMGVTFRFLNPDSTVAFSNSLTAPEIGDRVWKVCAWDLIAAHREREANRGKQDPSMVAAKVDPNEAFVELVKISNSVGYIKKRETGELLAGYAAFSNRTPKGEKTATMAKPRSNKWAAWLEGTFGLKCEQRNAKRMISDIPEQAFTYELKITGCSIGQLQKLVEEDFSLLPNELPVAVKPSIPKTEETPTQKTYTIKVNSYIVATGTEDEVRDRFEQELLLLGGPTGNHAVSLLTAGEIVERFNLADFKFVQVEDFDETNPEYSVFYGSTDSDFNVWLSAGRLNKWRHTHSVTGDEKFFKTREAAAVDAVRALQKLRQAKN